MIRSLLVLPLVFIFAAGCGSDSPFEYTPVQGKITYEDGTTIPAASIRLRFVSLAPPIDEKTHPRPASAAVHAEDGTFDRVTSYRIGDGLIPGKHKVLITATDAEGRSLVPPEYSRPSTTPLEIDTADTPLHLRVQKPEASPERS